VRDVGDPVRPEPEVLGVGEQLLDHGVERLQRLDTQLRANTGTEDTV
jgi:hypothetical protein